MILKFTYSFGSGELNIKKRIIISNLRKSLLQTEFSSPMKANSAKFVWNQPNMTGSKKKDFVAVVNDFTIFSIKRQWYFMSNSLESSQPKLHVFFFFFTYSLVLGKKIFFESRQIKQVRAWYLMFL